jgi:hypothetical protein
LIRNADSCSIKSLFDRENEGVQLIASQIRETFADSKDVMRGLNERTAEAAKRRERGVL